MQTFPEPLQFEWDMGNSQKNYHKSGVDMMECEEVFFDPNKKILKDTTQSLSGDRHILLGATKKNMILFIVFTIRNQKVRVISARVINKQRKKSL